MHLTLSEPEQRFREGLRAWLRHTLPSLPPKPAEDDWPADYGGRAAPPTGQLIFLQELARAGAPDVGVNFVGLLHAGPTLIAEGTQEQRHDHLPRILRGEAVVVPGLPGARRRQRPRVGAHLGPPRRRQLYRVRP
jgi:hypothetical protein